MWSQDNFGSLFKQVELIQVNNKELVDALGDRMKRSWGGEGYQTGLNDL